MKINLLAGYCLVRAAILSFLSPLMSKLTLEHIKDDPCQQENHMSNGVCPQQTLSFERTTKTPDNKTPLLIRILESLFVETNDTDWPGIDPNADVVTDAAYAFKKNVILIQ